MRRDVPHWLDIKPLCPAICHFGEKDPMIPLEGVHKINPAFLDVPVYVYPAGHGFNCDQRGSFDAASAKLARERTLAFLRKHVG